MSRLLSIADVRRLSDYPLDEEFLHRLPHATPLITYPDTILRDFPWISANYPEYNTHDAINLWISAAGGLVSSPHVPRSSVNDQANATGALVKAYRPPRYGRSAVVESSVPFDSGLTSPTDTHGLVDVKGCGVPADIVPARARRKNGLVLLPEAIQEIVNYRMLQRVFCDSGANVRCLPVYGLVSLGFNGLCEDYDYWMPAVTIVRQAHIRPTQNNELPAMGSTEMWVKHEIESLLRRYGVTSAPGSCALRILSQRDDIAGFIGGDHLSHVSTRMWRMFLTRHELEPPQLIRLNNVQLTDSCSINPLVGTLVDFGHYTCLENFDDHHFVTMVDDQPFNWGLFCRRDRPGWTIPNPHRRVDASLFGPVAFPEALCSTLGLRTAAHERNQRTGMAGTLKFGLELAVEYVAGRVSPRNMASRIDDFVDQACLFHHPAPRSPRVRDDSPYPHRP